MAFTHWRMSLIFYTPMEKYFNIRYLFGKERIWKQLDTLIQSQQPAYICVADGNVVSRVQNRSDYRDVVNGCIFSICDSGWVPLYLRWIYGIRREQYCGPMIFKDLVQQAKYRMFFMGTNQATLDSLKSELIKWNPEVATMTFYALPFKSVRDFDYKKIAEMVNQDEADIIWVALGAPKQDYFMHLLQPHLKRGVMLGVGAAFNFYSGLGEKRAPKWIRKCHIEFIYRIFQSPKKQIQRCLMILATMPKMFWQEYKRKRNNK